MSYFVYKKNRPKRNNKNCENMKFNSSESHKNSAAMVI